MTSCDLITQGLKNSFSVFCSVIFLTAVYSITEGSVQRDSLSTLLVFRYLWLYLTSRPHFSGQTAGNQVRKKEARQLFEPLWSSSDRRLGSCYRGRLKAATFTCSAFCLFVIGTFSLQEAALPQWQGKGKPSGKQLSASIEILYIGTVFSLFYDSTPI